MLAESLKNAPVDVPNYHPVGEYGLGVCSTCDVWSVAGWCQLYGFRAQALWTCDAWRPDPARLSEKLDAVRVKHAQHNQKKHGYRFGGTPSLSRARQLRKAGLLQDYLVRARVRQGKLPRAAMPDGTVPPRGGAPKPATPKPKKAVPAAVGKPKLAVGEKGWSQYQKRQEALFGKEVDRYEFDGGASKTYKVTLEGGKAVTDKPTSELYYSYHKGDMYDASDTGGAVYHVAASDIAASLGFGSVPVTSMKNGSLRSEFVEGTKTIYQGGMAGLRKSDLEELAMVDLIVGQSDGHRGNYVRNDAGHVWGVDYNWGGVPNTSKQNNESFPVGELTKNWTQVQFSNAFAQRIKGQNLGLRFSDSVPPSLQLAIRTRFSQIERELRQNPDGSWHLNLDRLNSAY